MKEKLQFIMEGGSVLRYHTRPGIRTDTDAHHMHGVAVLCSLLAGTDAQGRSGASASLLLAALTHDLAEQAASDMSAPSKRALGLRDMLAACCGDWTLWKGKIARNMVRLLLFLEIHVCGSFLKHVITALETHDAIAKL